MKKLYLSVLATLFCLSTFAQGVANDGSERRTKDRGKKGGKPSAYFNLSTGVNNNAGMIGFGIDVPVTPDISLEGGMGLGSWGYKFYGCGKYYFDPNHRGWAIGLGVTYCTGLENLTQDMETVYSSSEPVELKLYSQTNLFAAAYRFWNLGHRSNRVYIELGWSRALSTKIFEQTGGNPITTKSADLMRFIAPGGIILGLGFSFGGYK